MTFQITAIILICHNDDLGKYLSTFNKWITCCNVLNI